MKRPDTVVRPSAVPVRLLLVSGIGYRVGHLPLERSCRPPAGTSWRPLAHRVSFGDAHVLPTQRKAKHQNGVMAEGTFFSGDTPEARRAQLRRLTNHVESLWDQAVLLYRSGHRSSAGFLSIVVFEELAKVSFLRLEVVDAAPGSHLFPLLESDGVIDRKLVKDFRQQFNGHREKQAAGMASAFRMNSRVTRLFGEKEALLGQLATERKMELLRQSLLYVDLTVDGFTVPSERDDDEAQTLVALAGEALAEVGGLEPGEWSRLLDKVREFEATEGLPAD